MKSITELFPNASASTVAANPHLCASATVSPKPKQNDVQGNVDLKNVRRGRLNKTEAEYALILEAQKRKGEILRWEFEGITLRFANVKYTADFVVFAMEPDPDDEFSGTQIVKFIEIKGPYTKGKFERAVERFRHAKTYWPEFTFELHQKTKQGWKQIL